MANGPLDDTSLSDELPDAGADELHEAEVDRLVLASGRRIERLARALAPERRDADGKPLMLGERMRLLRDRLDAPTWDAYRAWSRARNAYVHAERDAIPDRAEFYAEYRAVAEALHGLAFTASATDASKARKRPRPQSTAPPALTPAEAAALAEADGGTLAPKRKPKPKRRPTTGKSRRREPSPAPERPSVTGPVLISVLLVALALAYNGC